MNNNSQKNIRRYSLIVSLFVHAILMMICLVIRYEREDVKISLTELLFIELAPEKPSVTPEYTRPRTPAERPATAPEIEEPRAPGDVEAETPVIFLPAETPVPEEPETRPETLLKEPRERNKFTPLASGEPMPPVAPPEVALSPFQRGEILFPGTPIELRPSGAPEEPSPPVPPEELRDERRRMHSDIMGFEMQGPLLLIPGIMHIAKSVVWDYRDSRAQENLERLRKNRFAGITEKDIRFLVLIWRDGVVSPRKMSRRERLFILECKPTKIQTNASYLDDLCRRGLTTSLMVKGDTVYRANVTRSEITTALCQRLSLIENTAENEEILAFINLIARYNDTYTQAVVVPE